MSAAVMRDDAITLSEEEKHLVIPVVGAERPAMVEDDRLSILRTPILVEDLGAVFRGDVFIAHGMFFLRFLWLVGHCGWEKFQCCGSDLQVLSLLSSYLGASAEIVSGPYKYPYFEMLHRRLERLVFGRGIAAEPA